MIVVTASEMRSLEGETIRRQGIHSFTLMDRAGSGVFRIALRFLASAGGVRAVVVCGKGNNGGDGMIAAELLAQSGVETSIFTTCELHEIEGDAAMALRPLIGTALEPQPLRAPEDFDALESAIERANLVVDAILGTGSSGAPRGTASDAIRAINDATGDAVVLSVDIPSGVHSDTGQVAGDAVKADLTTTIGLPKAGLFLYPAAEYAGKIEVVDISIPPDAAKKIAKTRLARGKNLAPLLPERPADAHKRTCGTVGIVAGSRGMTGAAALAGLSSMRAGVGLTYLWAPESIVPSLESKLTEVIIEGMAEADGGNTAGRLGSGDVGRLLEAADDYDVMLVGPGLRAEPDTVKAIHELVRRSPRALVLDADGLNACAADPSLISGRQGDTIITPHPGELAKLMNTTSAEVQSNRLGWARKAAKQLKAAVILKGARTIIAEPKGEANILTVGNPGMATAGSGDVLAGLVAGLWAQGMTAYSAALLGAYIHGLSGDIAEGELTQYSMIASDLIFYAPIAISKLAEAGEEDSVKDDTVNGAPQAPGAQQSRGEVT